MLLVVGISLLGLVLGACTSRVVRGSGDVVAEEHGVPDFDAIEAGGVADVTVIVDGKKSVLVSAEDNIIEYLTVEVDDGTLVLGTRPGVSLAPTEPIEVLVHAVAIDSLELSGAGSIEVDHLEVQHLFVEVSGVGDLDADLRADELEVRLSGAGGISLTGAARNMDAVVSGVGALSGEGLEVDDATVVLSGAGSAEVAVSDRLDVVVSGVGTVVYHGDPDLSIDESGVGTVEKGS